MHKKISKAVTGSVLAASMLASATAAFMPMSASAGLMVGQSTFDEGVGLPWHTCETNPAKQTFTISGGSYNVTVVTGSGSEGRWDLQLRHRGLKLKSGHSYKVSGEVTTDTAGYIYSKIGNYAGDVEIWHDLGAGEWQPVKLQAGQTLKFESTFTSNQDLDVAEWAFHYADNHGAHGNNDTGMPDGATLKFDNLVLECTTCGDTSGEGCNWDFTNEYGVITPHSNVRLNQVGYFTKLSKKATYVTEATSPLDFEIRDSSGKTVYTGKTQPGSGRDEDSGDDYHIIDFTDFKTEGSGYTIFVKDTTGLKDSDNYKTPITSYTTTLSGDKLQYTNKTTGETYTVNESPSFSINNNIYDGMLRDALNYYYQNRSGMKIESQYITSGDAATLAHQAGHTKDTAYVQSEWVKSYGGEFDGDKSYSIDGTGGWYDAGDHGKYVVNGGVSVWTLQNEYEWAKKQGTASKFDDGKTMAIPENSNKYPDILDESRYELEWMFKMMVQSNDPYWGKYEGMVYHKLHDHKWTGLATKCWDYESEWGTTRIVKPPTYAATLNMAACAAQAARLWKGIDDDFAAECLANAKKGYAAASASYEDYKSSTKDNPNNQPLYGPLDQAIGGGAYGDNYVLDDFYWAACELYATTGDSTYYNDLKGYSNANDSTGMDKAFSVTNNLGGGENNGSFSSFNWGCTSGLGTLSLYLNQDNLSASEISAIEDSIVKVADSYIDQENSGAMGVPYKGASFEDPVNIGPGITVTGYEWGSNSFVINNAIIMAYAYDIKGTYEYISGASTALDYILGRNGNGFSYVSGYGDYTLTYPHHRFWCNGVDPEFPLCPAGVMSGGPGAGMQDPYVGGLGYQRGKMASQKCYVDNAEAWSVNEVTINWNAPFAWVVSFLEDEAPDAPEQGENPSTQPTTGSEEDLLWGDADDNGEVNINDVVVIMAYANDESNDFVNAKAKKQADVFNNGDGVNASDAVSVQKYLAKILSELPESFM